MENGKSDVLGGVEAVTQAGSAFEMIVLGVTAHYRSPLREGSR